ncbi:hypothetical protein J7L67_05495 [bacterium]|nr:hypothetical protein [bacterium]
MKKIFIFSLFFGSLVFLSRLFSETDSKNEVKDNQALQEKQVAEKDNGGSVLNILFLPVKAFSKLGEHIVTGAGKDGSSFIDVLGENVSQGYKSQKRETNLTVIQ